MTDIRCSKCGKSEKRWLIIDNGAGPLCLDHFLEKNPITWPRVGLKAEP